MQLAGLEVAIYVYLSIKFVMHVNIKNGQHNHKAIVAAVLYTCMQHRSVFKQISTLHVLCSDVCCIAEVILQRPIASALYWAWLVRVLFGL